jgi:hypothetical protein
VAPAGSARAESPAPLDLETRAEFAAYQDSDAVTVFTPSVAARVKDRLAGWSAEGTYLVDVVSAASVDIVSTASPAWTELRHAASLGASYRPDGLGAAVAGSVSSEPDYLSLGAELRAMSAISRKNATLEIGVSYTRDVAGRKDTPFSVYSLTVNRYGGSASLELVLDRATTFTPVLDVVYESGRQEKPYRYLPIFDASTVSRVPPGASPELVNELRLPGRVAEHVPDSRARSALSGRLAHRFSRSTLLVADRLYADVWGLFAATLDGRFVLDVGRRFSIWPHGRAHVQSGVSFWRRATIGRVESGLVEAPTWRTGDRELGPLWSATLGPGARWDLGPNDPRAWSAVLELEGTYTRYPDALYTEQRWAGFASVQVEAKFR